MCWTFQAAGFWGFDGFGNTHGLWGPVIEGFRAAERVPRALGFIG